MLSFLLVVKVATIIPKTSPLCGVFLCLKFEVIMKYFKPHEFQCCCKYDCGLGFTQMNPDFLEKLEFARMLADVPFSLNSAIRCEDHNRDRGGSIGSSHMLGLAVDIRVQNSRARYKILYGLIKAGFNRIGIYETFIHVDDDKDKTPSVAWFSD